MSESEKTLELKQKIARERAHEREVDWEKLLIRIKEGDGMKARGNILYHTDPPFAADKLEQLSSSLCDRYPSLKKEIQVNCLDFLVKMAIDLRTYPVWWVLLKELDQRTVHRMAEKCLLVLKELLPVNPETVSAYEDQLRETTAARLQAEGLEDPGSVSEEVDALFGENLLDFIHNTVAEIEKSNLLEAARRGPESRMPTEIGNDYAAFLEHVIWQGGSFVTTNPVLVKMAWDIDRPFWDRRIDELICSRYSSSRLEKILEGDKKLKNQAVNEINSLITMAVVEENCRILRDIFLVTGGRRGYVSLQVNPRNHNNQEQMVFEAQRLYAQLEERLGGVPNVVFKLPATSAGRYAAEQLTQEGIGVTITLTFSAFQALGFAEVLKEGRALTSYIALMNGRVAYPIRDQLMAGNVENGREAARWAGVAIARKAYRLLYGRPYAGGLNIPRDKVRLLIASLRIYEEDWMPDISELWGCPVITFFPDVRRTYDRHPRVLDLDAVCREVPAEDMEVLFASEMFRRAWWVPGDPKEFAPERALTLTDQDAGELAAWTPVAQTLEQFIELYDEMGEMVMERMERIASGNSGEQKNQND